MLQLPTCERQGAGELSVHAGEGFPILPAETHSQMCRLTWYCGGVRLSLHPSKAAGFSVQVLSDTGVSARDATWFPGGMAAAVEGQALAAAGR